MQGVSDRLAPNEHSSPGVLLGEIDHLRGRVEDLQHALTCAAREAAEALYRQRQAEEALDLERRSHAGTRAVLNEYRYDLDHLRPRHQRLVERLSVLQTRLARAGLNWED